MVKKLNRKHVFVLYYLVFHIYGYSYALIGKMRVSGIRVYLKKRTSELIWRKTDLNIVTSKYTEISLNYRDKNNLYKTKLKNYQILKQLNWFTRHRSVNKASILRVNKVWFWKLESRNLWYQTYVYYFWKGI